MAVERDDDEERLARIEETLERLRRQHAEFRQQIEARRAPPDQQPSQPKHHSSEG